MNKKLVLIDGHSILNRAFYGVPDLTNAQGLHTNAVYGFLNILFKILEEEKPDYLAVAFDVKAPTFRHEMFKEYKGTRKPMPEELREQVPVIKEVLQAMEVCIMEQAGLEADDILGTLAKKGEMDGLDVSLVSGDRDLLQIASEKIKIRIPKTKGGKTEIEDYFAQDVKSVYQVSPLQFIDLKALMGDTADNIPGVPKVGEKTATSLIVEYGSIEELYKHVDEITKNSIRESLKENENLAHLSKALATIKIDCELALDYEKSKAEGYYTPAAYELCKKLEFKNFLLRFDSGKEEEKITREFKVISELSECHTILSKAEKCTELGFYSLKEKNRKELLGVALAFSEREVYYIPAEGMITSAYLHEAVKEISKTAGISTFDIKGEYAHLSETNLDNYFDILIAAYLLNPLKNDYEPQDIAQEYLALEILSRTQTFGKESVQKVYEREPEKVADYICDVARVAYLTLPILKQRLLETGMKELMERIEMPLSFVLYNMEQEGIEVRKEELKAYSNALTARIVELEKCIYEQSGTEFNINSPKQLGEILFEKMGLPGGKKTKTGYSTAADILEKLATEYPIVNDILEYRGLAKLKSTYAEGLATFIGEDRRIHTSFNQTITATGRISSTEPNLQNIPMRMELGRQIRKVFVPKDGCIFMDADYSQIELRVLAHMSGDEQLIEAYKMEEDIHKITAAKVFHTPLEEVTDLQRRNAKAVNFGIVYGISSFGLSQDLSISRKEATEYIEQYFHTYPKVKDFLDNIVEEAKAKGSVVTMFGRRRPIPELSSSNFMQRSFGERIAMNSPIQGTAADIMKIAMIKVFQELKEQKLQSKLILQVHDELLIETVLEEVEAVKQLLEKNMREAVQLAVSLEVDLHTGENWYEAK